jgi:hypothetical protein
MLEGMKRNQPAPHSIRPRNASESRDLRPIPGPHGFDPHDGLGLLQSAAIAAAKAYRKCLKFKDNEERGALLRR